jgi:hypothetical protein
METLMRTAKAQHLAKTIMDDLEALLSMSMSYEEPSASIAKALSCFLHGHMLLRFYERQLSLPNYAVNAEGEDKSNEITQ